MNQGRATTARQRTVRFGERSIQCHPSDYLIDSHSICNYEALKAKMKIWKMFQIVQEVLMTRYCFLLSTLKRADRSMFSALDVNVTLALFIFLWSAEYESCIMRLHKMLIDIPRINGLISSLSAIIAVRNLFIIYIFRSPLARVGRRASRKVTWKKGNNYLILSPLSLICVCK